MGHIVDQHDELDALGLAMTIPRQPACTPCERGSAAVEFALVLPALAMLMVGGLYTGLLMYSVAGLHSAVEQAARCYSVDASQCGSAAATRSYAQNNFYGVGTPTFIASTAPCGHQVSATLTFILNAAVMSWNVPLTATACFPLSD
jgi:Flp pilus assembly protein TadG